jgi:hypothetical protein
LFFLIRHLSAEYKKGFDTAFLELSGIRASGAPFTDSLSELIFEKVRTSFCKL